MSVGAPTCALGTQRNLVEFANVFKMCPALLFLRYHSVSIGHNESNQCFSGNPQSGDHFAAR